jgi:hypothetical protein
MVVFRQNSNIISLGIRCAIIIDWIAVRGAFGQAGLLDLVSYGVRACLKNRFVVQVVARRLWARRHASRILCDTAVVGYADPRPLGDGEAQIGIFRHALIVSNQASAPQLRVIRFI